MNRNEIIEIIRSLWCEELEINNDFDNDTSFFDLGGSSLKGNYIFGGIREDLGVNLMLHLLFEHYTVNAMADLVELEFRKKEKSEVENAK